MWFRRLLFACFPRYPTSNSNRCGTDLIWTWHLNMKQQSYLQKLGQHHVANDKHGVPYKRAHVVKTFTHINKGNDFMPLTDEEEKKFVFYIDTINASLGSLNDWERGFIADQVKRYEEFKSKINLSPKQWSVINKVYEKVTDVK